MQLFDTHAHMDADRFDQDRAEILADMPKRQIRYLMNVGCDASSSLASVRLAEEYPFIYAAVGSHPDDAAAMGEDLIALYRELATQHQKVRAIGEIGLDYHYEDNPSRDVQQEWFIEQIELAKELELPIIVHSRDAAQDTYEILRDYDAAQVGGVLHSYSGAPEMAQKYVDMGFYLGIGGMVTFENAKKVALTVEKIPLERLLIETDCPYLAPVPMRGKRNDSRNLRYTAARIAEIKGITPEEVARVTTENAKRLFGIS